MFCFLFCFTSCRKKTIDDLLAEAGRYMDSRMDTAHVILGKIPHPEQLQGKQKALYCRMKARSAGYVFAECVFLFQYILLL
jgi:hypothetical protein